jgi:hypothetical protein
LGFTKVKAKTLLVILVLNYATSLLIGRGGGGFDYSVFPEQPIVFDWNVYASPDYFSTTYTYTYTYRGVVNDFGASYPKQGNGYGGIIAYTKMGERKEYISQQLSSPLKRDSVYCLSFFVSRADAITHAIKNMGAYFSVNAPTLISNEYLSATPQVLNNSGFLTDTINWLEIKGCFIAQGGEQYVTLGNFNSNTNTDTLFVGSTNPLSNAPGYAYYYIDSVSLWKNNFPTFIKEENKNELVSVYPNPATTILKINYNSNNKTGLQIKINDMLGREVKQLKFGEEIDISDLENGIYFLSVYKNNQLIETKKIIKK